MNIVIDTNVLVSGLINPAGLPAQIIEILINDKIVILYDNRILHEYEEVLSRKKFNFPREIISPIIDYIKYEGIFILPEPIETKFDDPDDKAFYEVAITGKAKYLITGNKKHFPENKLIVTPAEFIKKFTK